MVSASTICLSMQAMITELWGAAVSNHHRIEVQTSAGIGIRVDMYSVPVLEW